MTGAAGRGVAAMTATEPERVTCLGTLPDGRACGQLLAYRSASGSVRVVVKCEEPILPPDDHYRFARAQVICPSCGQRARVSIKPKRAAA